MRWVEHLLLWRVNASGPGCYSCEIATAYSGRVPSSTQCWMGTIRHGTGQRWVPLSVIYYKLTLRVGIIVHSKMSCVFAPALSVGFWWSRIFELPTSSNWTGQCVSELSFILLSFPLMLIPSWNVNWAVLPACTLPLLFSASSLATAALRASATNLRPKTWPAPRSPPAPPPPPPRATTSHQRCSSGASGPGTSWSWRTSKTTTTPWTVLSENTVPSPEHTGQAMFPPAGDRNQSLTWYIGHV